MVTNEDKTYQLCKARHQLFLEALRHREQEVLRYLVIIGPALGGFVWLMSKYPKEISIWTFCFGSIGLISIMLLGACYCIALGYNYRCLVLQIAKEEKNMCISGTVLNAWPRQITEHVKRTKLGHYIGVLRRHQDSKVFDWAWCFPPELICVFWYAFVIGIIYLAAASCVLIESVSVTIVVAGFGLLCLGLSLFVPHVYGRKLRSVCEKEMGESQGCGEQNAGSE
ncbi:MAG TPA: hypothetical protein VMW72_04535 [Sedimentisphaerales bacterium]|nr:hypothetical protein [Sedimentisphaerales bacterium]